MAAQVPFSPALGEKPPSASPPIFQTWAAHGEEHQVRTVLDGANYINSNMVYIIVFILFTLALYYFMGNKATIYFLLVVLIGQLIIPGGTGAGITELTNTFKIFKG